MKQEIKPRSESVDVPSCNAHISDESDEGPAYGISEKPQAGRYRFPPLKGWEVPKVLGEVTLGDPFGTSLFTTLHSILAIPLGDLEPRLNHHKLSQIVRGHQTG